MRESRTEVIVGALVLAGAVGFMAYAVKATGAWSGGGSGYEVSASFRAAEGVSAGTAVRMSGVSIGTVTAVALNPQTFRADTRMRLDTAIQIPDDSAAVVASEGLLGGNYIEIVPGGSFDNLAAGSEIVDTQGSVSLLQLLIQYVAGGSSSDGAAG